MAIMMTDFVLSLDLDLKMFLKHTMGTYTAARFGLTMLTYRYWMDNKKTYFEKLLDSKNVAGIVPREEMNALFGHGLASFVSISREKRIVDEFVSQLVAEDLTKNLNSVLFFPDDMEKPVNHYYFGYNGLFSRNMDDLTYFSNYCQVLLAVSPSILFDEYVKFYDHEILSNKRGVFKRCLEVEFKNLEDQREYLKSYVTVMRD